MNSRRSAFMVSELAGKGPRPAVTGTYLDCRTALHLGVEAVEPGRVGAGDLVAVLWAGVLEVACHDLLRVRPSRGLVRVIGGPHQLVDPNEVAALHADIIVDIGGPHLALEVFAGLQLVREARGNALAFEGAVHALQVVGQPADIVL